MAGRARKKKGDIRIGLSGWSYAGWKDTFYAGVKRADWLAFAASRFSTLEANATFYREQREKTLKHWREQTPAAFRFAIKGHRYLTHRLRLKDAEDSVLRQRDNATVLGDCLGCVLWQLPAGLKANHERLADFLGALGQWRGPVHVMEFRHASWFTDETAAMLDEAGVANCISHAADWEMWDRATGPLVYLRLHGAPRTYYSAYGPKKLSAWAERIERWRRQGRNVFVYFDNDAEGAAFRDAAHLQKLVPGGRP